MKKLVAVFSLPILSIFFLSNALWAQQKEPPPRLISAVSFFVSANYFSPKLDDVNAVYSTIEKNYYLPAGTDFKNYYSVSGGIKISPVEQQTLQAEVGISLYKTPLGSSDNSSKNFLQLFYTGGTYLINFPLNRLSFFAGAGAGYIRLNTERTYSGQIGVAHVNANLFQVHGTIGAEFFHSTGVSFAVEGGYAYATTPLPERSDLDFTLHSITGGIKVSVPLINKF
ncbi:MAG: hypothetical protein KGJ59_05520 [Bacteroidota bacterium]|nr:hypothetical protein [Bacteroidota bacterium]